jgi:hypothetical protein
MGTEERRRRQIIEEQEAARIDKFMSAGSFQPTRPAPLVPFSQPEIEDQEETSRFSDSDSAARPSRLSRLFSFKRGKSRRFGRTRTLPIIEEPSEDYFGQSSNIKRLEQKGAAAAASSAFATSNSMRRLPENWPRRIELESDMMSSGTTEWECSKQKGLIPPWRLMSENRRKSIQGSFLKAGTLRKIIEGGKRPKRRFTLN